MENPNIIHIDSEAFKKLIEVTIKIVKATQKEPDKWVNEVEAMRLLNISSKTTLLMLRNTGKIRYSQPMHKILLYDRQSILDYLESYARETF